MKYQGGNKQRPYYWKGVSSLEIWTGHFSKSVALWTLTQTRLPRLLLVCLWRHCSTVDLKLKIALAESRIPNGASFKRSVDRIFRPFCQNKRITTESKPEKVLNKWVIDCFFSSDVSTDLYVVFKRFGAVLFPNTAFLGPSSNTTYLPVK